MTSQLFICTMLTIGLFCIWKAVERAYSTVCCVDVSTNIDLHGVVYFDSCGLWDFDWSTQWLASFPGSPRARTKNTKERGEPGKIYHVGNVIGRENLITCGQTNEFAHALIYSFSRESFMADRTGLDSTMLHYLAVQRAMVSVHRPVHSKSR